MADLRVEGVPPFQLGWEGVVPASATRFPEPPAIRTARLSERAAALTRLPLRARRCLPGEAVHWGVLLVNDGAAPRPLRLTAEVPPGARVSVWYVHPWVVSGRAVRPGRPALVPELLLKHDRIDGPASLAGSVEGLPDHGDAGAPVVLRLEPGACARLLVKVRPGPGARGPVVARLLADGTPVAEFEARVLPVAPAAGSWRGLYYGLIPGSSSPRYGVEPEEFRRDLACLQDLGCDTLVVDRHDLVASLAADLVAAGLRRIVVQAGAPEAMAAARRVAGQVGIDLAFATADEPHRSPDALLEHLHLARQVRAIGGRTFTAISLALLEDPQVKGTLDWPNLAVWSLPAPLATGLALPGPIYWQCAFPRPSVNRFLAGPFAAMVGARGAIPFVFRDGYPLHDRAGAFADDLSPLYGRKLRSHLLTFPGRAGPVRTLQAEALAAGYGDGRVLATLRHHAPEAFAILVRRWARALSPALTAHGLQDLYNGDVADPRGELAPVTWRWLERERERALDVLAHAIERGTAWRALPGDPADVRVVYDRGRDALSAFPPGLVVEGFPLALVEGFPDDADAEAVARALFGAPACAVGPWTLEAHA